MKVKVGNCGRCLCDAVFIDEKLAVFQNAQLTYYAKKDYSEASACCDEQLKYQLNLMKRDGK